LARLYQGDSVVPLAQQLHRLAVEYLQHGAIAGQIVGIQERFASHWHELGIEHSLSHPARAGMQFVPVICGQRSLEDRLQSIARGTLVFVSSGGHVAPNRSVPRRMPGTFRELLRNRQATIGRRCSPEALEIGD
jgi:hypothetical protein